MKNMKNKYNKIYESKSLLLFFAAALIAVFFLIGCAQQPSTPTGQVPAEVEKAAAITFKTSPSSTTAGESVTVAWDVSGSGKIPHTAVHYGPASVPEPKGPSDYPKATAFQCQETPCNIPNSFSAALKIDEPGTYYYRAHAVVGGKNVWSEEKMIKISAKVPAEKETEAISGQAYGITISNTAFLPRTAKIFKGDTLVWENKDILPHTVSSYGGDELASDALAQGETYSHTFNTEGTFKYQCNIHPLMVGEVIVLSREPKITIAAAPPLVATGQAMPISWKIDGESTTTPHTAIHYGQTSVPEPKGPQDYPSASNYFCASKPCNIPNEFMAQITIAEPGTYYYRAHAVVGGKNVWSDEKNVSVEKRAEPVRIYGGGGGGY